MRQSWNLKNCSQMVHWCKFTADFYPTVKVALRHEGADSEEDRESLGCHLGQGLTCLWYSIVFIYMSQASNWNWFLVFCFFYMRTLHKSAVLFIFIRQKNVPPCTHNGLPVAENLKQGLVGGCPAPLHSCQVKGEFYYDRTRTYTTFYSKRRTAHSTRHTSLRYFCIVAHAQSFQFRFSIRSHVYMHAQSDSKSKPPCSIRLKAHSDRAQSDRLGLSINVFTWSLFSPIEPSIQLKNGLIGCMLT